MTVTEITQIGTLTLATIAAYLSIKTFKSNKKQELENHLFKIKLEAFSNIAFEIDNFFIILNRGIVKIHDLSFDRKSEETDELKKLSVEIDEQIYKCHTLIVKYSVYFSKKSIDALLAFTDNLIGSDHQEAQGQSVDFMQWMNDYYQEQLKSSDKAIDSLREELQLEKLHHSLYNRSTK